MLEKVKELSDQIHIVSKELLSKDFEDQSNSQDQMKKQELDKSEQEVVKALTEQKTEIESQIKENKELIQKLSEIKDDSFLNTTTGLTFVSSLENKILELQDLKRDLENTFKKSVAFHNSVEQAKFIKEKQADKKKINFIIRDLFI
ncbi:hypothetical protein [Mycoplasma sp. 1654_15]|uniref:hypothetical protein n=1 Tax=Mycoplasma sp. 1654_15 TaxID=2725994 RepID=UPI001449C7A0|nr:hypothetical protein [Mycoplasma sp. 1654_15]QJB71014.1 hypothetical protein HF996_00575 [Mycoplasma sp. 1654_15]